MTIVSRANWFCTHCGARGSGNGQAYDGWLRGHSCLDQSFDEPPVAKPAVWKARESQPRHQSVPGRMTFTVLEKKR